MGLFSKVFTFVSMKDKEYIREDGAESADDAKVKIAERREDISRKGNGIVKFLPNGTESEVKLRTVSDGSVKVVKK